MKTTTIVNIALHIIGIIFVAYWVSSASSGSASCITAQKQGELGAAIFLLCLSVVGLILAPCRFKILQKIYMTILCLLLLVSIVWTGVLFLGVRKVIGKSDEISDGELHIESYRPWFRKSLLNDKELSKFKECLIDTRVCKHFDENHQFQLKHEPRLKHPIEFSCCRPPPHCGFMYNNKTDHWDPPKLTAPAKITDDNDCRMWKNEEEIRCYDCEMCKAGYLVRYDRALAQIGISFFLYAVIFLGSFAFDTDQDREHEK